jgi:hypothetical protein
MMRVRSALLAIVLACAPVCVGGTAWAHPHEGGFPGAAAVGVDCATPKDKADAALCAQWSAADAAEAALVWRRWEVFLLMAALAFCAWAARSAAKAVEAAKKEQTGDRPFAFLIVHGLSYEPIAGGQGGVRATLEGRQFKLSYVIKNYGRSACIVRRVSIAFAQGAALARATDRIETVSHPSWVIPENGEEADQVSRETAWSVEGMEAYRDGRETLFVSGEIHYEDLSGAQYVRRFCIGKGIDTPAAEAGGAAANYDRRVYSDPRWIVSKAAAPPPRRPPPKTWPPEEITRSTDDVRIGSRVIPMKK